MKYFVFHGVVTPDSHDASEGNGPYRLDACDTEAQVQKLRKEHEEELENEEASHPVFRVIHGDELVMDAEKRVTSWKLRKK